MKKLIALTALLLSSQVFAAAPEAVVINDFEYTNKYELALRQAKHSDKGKAFPVLLEYAKYGEKLAQYMVGNFYLAGIGTEANPTEGLIWMGTALEQRTGEWERSFEGVTSKLSAEQKTMLDDLIKKRIELYGVQAQKMSCRNEAAVMGSNKRHHVCTKIRDGAQRVTVVKYPNS
jgi:TPR repeat protein